MESESESESAMELQDKLDTLARELESLRTSLIELQAASAPTVQAEEMQAEPIVNAHTNQKHLVEQQAETPAQRPPRHGDCKSTDR